MLPHRIIVNWLNQQAENRVEAGEARAALRNEVSLALAQALSLLPVRFTCYAKALAAQAMMRRRGSPATFVFGVRVVAPEGSHAWLEQEGAGIIGVIAARGFHPIRSYPRSPS